MAFTFYRGIAIFLIFFLLRPKLSIYKLSLFLMIIGDLCYFGGGFIYSTIAKWLLITLVFY
jgi:hypothetical protein